MEASETVHPKTQVQPLQAAKGPDSEDLNWSNVEPGLKYAVKNGLVALDTLPENTQALFNDNL